MGLLMGHLTRQSPVSGGGGSYWGEGDLFPSEMCVTSKGSKKFMALGQVLYRGSIWGGTPIYYALVLIQKLKRF